MAWKTPFQMWNELISQPPITYSKLTIETLEQGMKYVNVNNKDNVAQGVKTRLVNKNKITSSIFIKHHNNARK